jgi:hypothetical protein
MPIHEADPWRAQYFADVPCPARVHIPTDDPLAYELYPQHRWVYNKLLIAKSQGLACGTHGTTPVHFPVFSKPVTNLRGMGLGSRVLHDAAEFQEVPVDEDSFFQHLPPEAHAMPPGGFRLGVINCTQLSAGFALRARMAADFGLGTSRGELHAGARAS